MTEGGKNIVIRDARNEDADVIADLVVQLGYPATADDIRSRSAHATAGGTGRILVAEIDGVVKGLATLDHIRMIHRPGGDVCRLMALVVDETERGTGVGRALVDAVEEHARTSGCWRVEVTSAGPREAAHAFYERVGYTEWPKRFIKDL